MSYPPAGPSGPPPQTFTHQPQLPADKPKRLLGMPIGALIAMIGALLTLCCICSFAGVFVWRFMPSVISVADDPETALPAEVTVCEVTGSSYYDSAHIKYTFTNETSSKSNFSIDFEVRTDSGIVVGNRTEWALGVEPGQTHTGDFTFELLTSGGKTCHVVKIS